MKMRLPVVILTIALVSVLTLGCGTQPTAEPLFKGDETPASDAVVLFDGKDLSGWVQCGSDKPAKWKVENGYAEVRGGNICTKEQFGDCQLHIEFWLPLMKDAKGQQRANSGVYVQGAYEIQVLDSYGLKSGDGDCGAIYGVAVPLVNACRPPEHWQTFDIVFRAPRFDEQGRRVSNARMTVFHNGVLIHDNVEVEGPTRASLASEAIARGPIMLQDHGAPVRYRNIWLRPL